MRRYFITLCLGFGALGLGGCCGYAPSGEFPARMSTDTALSTPQSVLAALTPEQAARVEALAATVDAPATVNPRITGSLDRVYQAWYQRGYAYALVVGTLPASYHWDRGAVGEARARHDGWLDGLSAAGYAGSRLDAKRFDGGSGGMAR